MKIILQLFLVTAILSFLLPSCAEEKNVSNEAIERELLDAYMVVTYGSDRTAWPAWSEKGYYYIPLKTAGSGVTPNADNWIRYDLSVSRADQTLVSTSVADIAKKYGIHSYATYYAPYYYAFGPSYSYIPSGVSDAMDKYMAVGDSLRLILPPNLAQGLNSDYNYSRPVIVDVAMREINARPEEAEGSDLIDYRNLSYPSALPLKGESGKDTTGIFFQELVPSTDTVVIKDGYTVYVSYVGKYLNGHVFDTNIADTAIAHNIYAFDRSKYSTEGLSVTIGADAVVAGFEAALKEMKAGSEAVVFFTSSWGYGNYGQSDSGPYYTPMLFYLRVNKVSKNA